MAPPNPLVSANIFSRFAFSWVDKLFAQRGNIDADDLWALIPTDDTASVAATLRSAWVKEQAEAASQARAPSLPKAYMRAFLPRYALITLIILLKAVFVLAQTQFLALLLGSLADPSSTDQESYLYALGLCLTACVGGMLHHHFFFNAWRCGMHWRASAVSLIFEKSLVLRLDALSSVSAGFIINIASNDVERFQKLAQMGTYLVVAPLEAVVIIWLIWREVGIATLAGIGVLVLLVVIQTLVASGFGKLRSGTASITDARVRMIGQVINGIRVLKMYGWEPAFFNAVLDTRAKEVQKVKAASLLRGINEGVFTASQIIIGAATFFTVYAMGNPLSPRMVFTTLSLFAFLQVEATKFMPQALEGVAEVLVSLRRIQSFLLLPEVRALAAPNTSSDASVAAEAVGPAVQVRGLTCSWVTTVEKSASDRSAAEESHETLRGIDLSLEAGKLCAIVGPVGSGKSSLLMALLGEIVPSAVSLSPGTASRGEVHVKGKIAYISQNPWIITATVKENITFGLAFDKKRYQAAVAACCLTEDFASFQHGDDTIVGERGINLSGGQRARIGLARACYLDADVYLLDDPLSAVDARVGRQLFERCICGLLASKTRMLVTHQLQFARGADWIVVLDAGKAVLQGTFEDLSSAYNASVAASRAPAASGAEGSSLQSDALPEVGDALADLFASAGHAGQDELHAVAAASPAEDFTSGTVREASTADAAEAITLAAVEAEIADTPVPDVSPTKSTTDSAAPPASPSDPSKPSASSDGSSKNGLIQAEGMASGGVRKSVFVRYWAGAGGPLAILYLTLLLACGTVVFVLSAVYLARWAGSTAADQTLVVYPAAYGGLVAGSLVLSLWRSVAFFVAAIQSSKHLHDAAFQRVLRAPMLFFDSNPAGRILNRLSKDVGLMDDFLPFTGFDFFSTLFICIGTVALVCAITPWILLCTLPLIVIFFMLRRYFMLTSRTVKRLESVSRSPVYSLMSEVLAGLPVIRAFRIQELLVQRYRDAADANLRAYFIFLATSRWLGVRLDALCFALLICTTFACVALRQTVPPALVGLSVSYILAITNSFQWCVRQSTEYEAAMVSVERVLEYTDVDVEDVDVTGADPVTLLAPGTRGIADAAAAPSSESLPAHSHSSADGHVVVHVNALASPIAIPTSWPASGDIRITNLWMRYRAGLAPVLRGLSVQIPSGARVGVVGRTGAGKSSFLLAILRLVEPLRHPLKDIDDSDAVSGAATGPCGIEIDGQDIANIHLTRLRRSISVIPQDPVLYAGTVRANLDPFSDHSDEECFDALDRVQLLQNVRSRGGLEAVVDEGGSNLSIGQRQLLCLARAVLRRNKVLLMDEASANVDLDTDAAIQSAVRTAFVGATIITIAHRLATVIDYDYVMVMDGGRAAEFGPPAELLSPAAAAGSKPGPFYSLVHETGAKTAASLTRLAIEAAQRRR